MTNADDMLESAKAVVVAGDMAKAESLCRTIIGLAPSMAGPWIILGDLELRNRRPLAALARADKAIALEPQNPYGFHVRCRSLVACSRLKDAFEAAEAAASIETCPASLLDSLGMIFSQLGRYPNAHEMFKRAVAAEPRNAGFIHNLAVAERTFGALEDAERHCDQAISINKHLYESYFIRADLRKQTKQRNHVAQMEALIAEGIPDQKGEILVRFALGKEYDDLGDYARAFHHIKSGADLQRRRLRYDIKGNIGIIDRIIRAQTKEALDGLAAGLDPHTLTTDDPVFIVGLPRSGTTLVERIVAGHSCVFAAGELGTLPNELIRAAITAGLKGGGEWVEKLSAIDVPATGHAYARVARETGISSDKRFIDKLPPNFLYCGAIRLAIPNARIIALKRAPMDSCFALYRALFAKGVYPFSYDMSEVAAYFAAFRRLMAHWKATLPADVFLEVSYEDVVADLEGQSRRIIDFLGLPWEDGVLRFHESHGPVTTASAVQVRQPIYASSIGKWRNYATELEPLRAKLAELMPGEDLG